jgi:hypothetical protein
MLKARKNKLAQLLNQLLLVYRFGATFSPLLLLWPQVRFLKLGQSLSNMLHGTRFASRTIQLLKVVQLKNVEKANKQLAQQGKRNASS